ncbi:MAG: hypothetical protein IIZ67_03460 [Bacilli bacterium]|nr:hypothetical protein [Bacilli bacterium]
MFDESRGQKGGINDRRRVMKLRKKEIERLKELNEEESLKKELKERETKELLSIIPIVIIKILIDNTRSKKIVNIDRKKDIKEKEKKEETITQLEEIQEEKKKEPSKESLEQIKPESNEGFVKVDRIEEEKNESPIIENIILPGILLLQDKPKIIKVDKVKDIDEKELKEDSSKEETKELEEQEEIKSDDKEKSEEAKEEVKEETRQEKKEEKSEKKEKSQSSEEKQSEIDKKLERLQSNKIVEKYADKLMAIRHDLRNIIFEYNMIVDRNNKLQTKEEAEKLLDSLNKLIKKIDELKKKLDIPDSDKYDETYLYAIAEEYMKEFSNNKPIKEIKSSPLYISISEKVKELDKAKNKLKKTIDDNKKSLGIKEAQVEKLKSNYDKMSDFDKKMDDFTTQAEKELKDVEDKVKNSVDIKREMEYRVVEANRMSRLLVGLMAVEAMLPTNRSTKRAALIATAGAYVLNRLLNRRRVQVRENVKVTVKDYSERIEKDLDKIEDVQKNLSKNCAELDKIISLLENDYKNVVSANSEYKELLINLKIIKSNLQEKEYDLKRINDDTKKSLDENNHKVMRYN